MAVTVKQLYKSIQGDEIELLAGAGGLNRVVRWVHMVESTEIATFLEGGEIVFTTGVGTTRNEDVLEIVKNAAASGCSAIVLNVGPYIKEIDYKIIEFCEERQLPLFKVPWHIYMSEIMRKFCFMITISDKKHLEMSSAIKNAVLFPEQTELYVPHLESYGLHINESYRVMLIRVTYKNADHQEVSRRIIMHQIENYITQSEWNCTAMELDGYILLLFAGLDYTEEMMEKCMDSLTANCIQLRKEARYDIGIGQATKNMYCISRSFREAKSVIDLREMDIKDTCFYSRLGLYKLLFGITDKAMIRQYVEETIGSLLAYDHLNDNNLTEVLRVYLKHNGSVKEAADEMFVHRNTINYKIRKIGELLGVSLNDYEVCSELNVALKLYDIGAKELGHI